MEAGSLFICTPPGIKNVLHIMCLVNLVQPAGISQWKVVTKVVFRRVRESHVGEKGAESALPYS